jgi:alpha-N-arabinofuranosidase
MSSARLVIDPDFSIGQVDKRLFGSFVEHIGRCVYTGLFEPGHPRADALGLRQDVLDLVQELGVTLVRYPGGNFVSGYNWEDGVGPRDQRPARLDLAWRSLESNHFGLNEFVEWTQRAGIEPMLVVNLGTRGLDAARHVVEYCNHPGSSYWSDLRRRHGVADPHRIRLWGLGNEMDGPWQIAHKTADEYGRAAVETAKAMRWVDPDIELVVCGSSMRSMSTFPDWDARVLEHTYEHVDYLSIHGYYHRDSADAGSYLASARDMDAFIDGAAATCDYVQARTRSRKRMHLSFDEWNVAYRDEQRSAPPPPWSQAPRLGEDVFSARDAVVFGSLLITLLRHADRVKIACQALLVNVLAPIVTEPGEAARRQAIFYPLAQVAQWGRGEVLRVEPTCAMYETAAQGTVPVLEAVATLDETAPALTLFVVNRAQDEAVDLECDLRALRPAARVEHLVLDGRAAADGNTSQNPAGAQPRPTTPPTVDAGRLRVQLAPISWNVIRLELQGSAAE